MVIAANAAVGKAWAHHATGILCGLLAGAMFLFAAIDYATAGTGNPADHYPAPVDFAFMATALVAAAVASKPVREFIARFIPIDPDSPIHSLALALTVILFGTQLASIALTDVLAADQQAPPLSVVDLLANELPLLVLALAGVGLWLRRDFTGSASRLGFVVPAWWQLALALAAGGAFYAFSIGSDQLSHLWTPDVAHRLDVTTEHLFGTLTRDPAGVIAIAVLPAVCEDALFRGALQPRFGLVLTAAAFTAFHAEYGLSLDLATIFVFALALGLVRKYANTTASGACHLTYNLLTGIGLSGIYQYAGIAIELLLIAVVAYALWKRRRSAAVDNRAVQETRVG